MEDPGEIVLLIVLGIASIRADILLDRITKILEARAKMKVQRTHRLAHPNDQAHPNYLDK